LPGTPVCHGIPSKNGYELQTVQSPYQQRQIPTKLKPYDEHIKQALLINSYCPKRERRMALMLLVECQTVSEFCQGAIFLPKTEKVSTLFDS
jgi:hypothetical protein